MPQKTNEQIEKVITGISHIERRFSKDDLRKILSEPHFELMSSERIIYEEAIIPSAAKACGFNSGFMIMYEIKCENKAWIWNDIHETLSPGKMEQVRIAAKLAFARKKFDYEKAKK